MKKAKFKLSELLMDPKLTFIRKPNPVIISEYRQNYREGATFPLIVVDEKTNFIVSGNQRYSAMLQEYGGDHVVEVILRNYLNEKDRLMDFAKENTKHGLRLDGYTKRHLVNNLFNEGATKEELSQLFNISVKKVEDLGDGYVNVIIGNNDKGKSIVDSRPAKRGFEPPREITVQEYQEHHQRDHGLPLAQKISELVRWLSNGLIIPNEKNITLVEVLMASCAKWLEEIKVGEAKQNKAG
jgi:hypothetical protein